MRICEWRFRIGVLYSGIVGFGGWFMFCMGVVLGIGGYLLVFLGFVF